METIKYLVLSKRITQNKLAMHGLADAAIFRLDLAVTWKCNNRCKYCKIWELYAKNPRRIEGELTKEDYEKLFDQLKISWLHVTGGEPFLKENLSEIITSASEKTKPILIDISTNGFLVNHTVNSVQDILQNLDCKFIVGVSIDGPSEAHEKSRGVPGGWNKAITTYLQLREMKEEFENLDVHINHFISPMNVLQFGKFVSELKENDIDTEEVSFEVARNSPFFMNEEVGINTSNRTVISVLGVLKKIENIYNNSDQTIRIKLRKRYVKEMISFLSSNKRSIRCAASYSSIFIDPYGNVYPCSQMKIPVGNIKQNDIKTIVESEVMKEWMKKFKNCQLCLSGCEGITSIVQNLPFSLI
jgi:sulfatase maturation enzyme AslB (radical SAM superfamily)